MVTSSSTSSSRKTQRTGRRAGRRRPDVFAALADPTRRRLLDLLRRGERATHELADRFDVSRPAISQHLGALEDAGLVEAARHGKERRYRLRGAGLRRLHAWLKKYEVFWDTRLAKLGQVLDRGEEEP